MLVLSRRTTEKIVIEHAGSLCTVSVLELRHTGPLRVKLGFDAPSDWIIHRLEVYDQIQLEKETPQ